MAGSSRDVRLVFTADNRSAVRAISGIADQSEKTTRAMKDDSDEQTVALAKVRDSADRVKDAMMGLAGMVGIGGVVFGLKDMVTGGMALQAQQAQLQAALKATGEEAGSTGAQLKSYAESLSTSGGFAMTQNLSALTAFVRETGSATKAQSMLTLATNIARGRNMDLATSQQIVQRAYTGTVGRLQALLGPMVAAREAQVGLSAAHAQYIASLQNEYQFAGVIGQMRLREIEANDHITAQQAALAQMTDKHATAQMVLADATRVFAGSTSAYSHTTQGELSNLTNTFHNLIDELGQSLLPIVNTVLGAFASLAQWMSRNKTLVAATVGPVLALAAAWGTMKVLSTIRSMAIELATALKLTGVAGMLGGEEAAAGAEAATVAWDTFMTSTIVGIVLVGLVELVEHWKAVEKAVVAVWHGIESAFTAVWSFIKDHWALILSILTGPIGAAVIFIVTHFGEVKTAIGDVWKFIEGIGQKILNALTWPFRKAFDIVKGIWGDVTGIFGSIVGAVEGHARGGVVGSGTYRALGGPIFPGGPMGTDTVPIWATPGEGVLTTQAMQNIGGASGLQQLNSGQGGLGGNVSINPSQTIIKLDGKTVGEAVVKWALNQAARGTSSMVGGSLVTGAPGLPA
jgi:hypothetical protein